MVNERALVSKFGHERDSKTHSVQTNLKANLDVTIARSFIGGKMP